MEIAVCDRTVYNARLLRSKNYITHVMFSAVHLVGLAVIVAVSRTLAQIPANCDRTYSVAPGDTCDGISAAQNVSTFQLADVNPGINAGCTDIFPQEELCLGIQGQDCSTVTVIQSGDLCTSIAQNAGIPLSTLLSNNPNVNSDCSNIYPGEVLCTSSTVFPYSS